MRQIASARAAPDLATIRLDDQTQQPMLSLTDVCVSGIDVIDERVLAIPVVLDRLDPVRLDPVRLDPVRLDPVQLVHNGDTTEHLFGCM